jgi:hypothetical protein
MCGGAGWVFDRRRPYEILGLGADNLLAVTLVLANGTVLSEVTKDTQPEALVGPARRWWGHLWSGGFRDSSGASASSQLGRSHLQLASL